MRILLFALVLTLSSSLYARQFPVTYTMQVAPDCIATFEGWVDINMNPFSPTFLEATGYGGILTITGNGCLPGSYPVSGNLTGSIPENGVANGELNPIGYEAVIRILRTDPGLMAQIDKIING